MASKYDGKTTAIETHDNSLGEGYHKSDGNEETDISGVEINGAGVGDDAVSPEIVGQALETLEKKKTAWYAYLTTADFWFVLALG